MDQQIPLNYEASAGDTHKQMTTTLPPEVVQCLENARFLHLATCLDNVPNVSLMNYTYIAESPYSASPVIVMTTNHSSKKTTNMLANANVSLLVHDWVSHRPSRRLSGGSPAPPPSSLATLLQNLNSSAMSSISATINGTATLLPTSSPEELFYRDRHLENNTYSDEPFGSAASPAPADGAPDDSGRFVAGDDVRIIVVEIRDVRISDWKGAVKDWVIVRENEMVNGVR